MNRYELGQEIGQTSAIPANKLIKNTYMLLSATLFFSAVMAALSIALKMPTWTYLVAVIASMVLGIFVLPRTADSSKGIGVIFLITGLMGFGLGAILSQYLALPKGPETIATAFGGTGIIFLGLSAYALNSKRDFSFMGGFLFAGMLVVVIAAIANIFLEMPVLSLVISSAVILLMSGFILFDTSRMVNGGETNYINATYGLYLSIFNLFISLLNLLMAFAGDD